MIPPELHRRLRRGLVAHDAFASDGTLRDFFIDSRLQPWRDTLPEADRRDERASAVIAHMTPRYHARSGDNALFLMLQVLYEQTDEGDHMHVVLQQLAAAVEHELGRAPQQETGDTGADSGVVSTVLKLGYAKLHTLAGHSERVNSVAFSPDGALLASGGGPVSDGFWGSFLRGTDLIGETFGSSAYIWGNNDAIRLWRMIGGELFRELKEFDGAVRDLCFSPDGLLLVAGFDNSVGLWRVADGGHFATLQEHTGSVTAVAYTGGGALLVSASMDGTIRLWRDGECIKTLLGYVDGVTALAIAPDSRLMASASANHTLRLWRLPEGEALAMLSGHESQIRAMAFSVDGAWLASGDEKGNVRLWKMPGGQPGAGFGVTGAVMGLAFSPDGRWFVAASSEGFVRVRRLPSFEAVPFHFTQRRGIHDMAFSPDSRVLAMACDDKKVRVWRLEIGD